MNSASLPTVSNFRQFLKELKYAPLETLLSWFPMRGRRGGWLRRYLARRRARYPEQVAALQAILSAHHAVRAVFVFPPSLDWQRQLFQRPQQLARALAQQGALVFYCQLTPPAGESGFVVFGERLYVCALPLEIFSVIEQPLVYCLAWNRKYLLKFARPRIVYDHLDAIETFDGDHRQLIRDHQALLGQAELVLATARQLPETIQPVRPDALYLSAGQRGFQDIRRVERPLSRAGADETCFLRPEKKRMD